MTCLAAYIVRADAHKLSMFFLETRDPMIAWKKGCDVRVARFAHVRCFSVIVTRVACSHRGHICCACIFDLLQPLVTCLALNVHLTDVFLVRENDLPRRVGKGDKVFLVNVTVRAVVFHLIFVTGGTIRLFGQEVV
jgi:hypothetical protein